MIDLFDRAIKQDSKQRGKDDGGRDHREGQPQQRFQGPLAGLMHFLDFMIDHLVGVRENTLGEFNQRQKFGNGHLGLGGRRFGVDGLELGVFAICQGA